MYSTTTYFSQAAPAEAASEAEAEVKKEDEGTGEGEDAATEFKAEKGEEE